MTSRRKRKEEPSNTEAEGLGGCSATHAALCGLDLAVPEGADHHAARVPTNGRPPLVCAYCCWSNPADTGAARIAGFDVVKQPTAVRGTIIDLPGRRHDEAPTPAPGIRAPDISSA